MKKLTLSIIIAVLAAGAAIAGDSEYSITVGTESTVILPPRVDNNYRTGLWTTNTAVVNGEILRVLSTKQDYLVLVAGTTDATDYPTGVTGQVETNGTAIVIHCSYRAPRTAAHVTQESIADIWYHTGMTATTNGGEFAFTKGQQYRTDEDGPVSAIASDDVKLSIKDK